MKGIHVLTARTQAVTSLVRRRRNRQSTERAPRPVMSPELADAHVQALVAMAAADGCITGAEADEVLAVVEGMSLPAADRSALRARSHELVSMPPELESVCDALSSVEIPAARARVLAFDLARIASVEAAGAPRELLLMERVCEVLGVAPVALALHPETGPATPSVQRRRPITMATQRTIRESVIRALEAAC